MTVYVVEAPWREECLTRAVYGFNNAPTARRWFSGLSKLWVGVRCKAAVLRSAVGPNGSTA
eukprot:scaffold145540_cov136-Phaeocystis_antarctica.AAC.1